MSCRRSWIAVLGLTMFAVTARTAIAQQSALDPQTNSAVMDANGTEHVTRVVPVPQTVSPEAQAMLRENHPDVPETLAQRRAHTDSWQTAAGNQSRLMYPVDITDTTIAGVPVRDVRPVAGQMRHADWVLMNLHGGGFNSDSGSFTESIPMANLVHARVVAVLYRLAPEHPFPAALDDAVAVYRELLKTYQPQHIVIYGTSAGAILTGEVAVKLKQLGLPEPAALGIFSGMGDFSRNGDSQSLFTLRGFPGNLPVPDGKPHNAEYVGSTNPRDPVLSPVFADLHGLPPTLFITSERDMLLSGTTILDRAFLRAGDHTQLIVFEGLPHAFWNDLKLPETREAYDDMSSFFTRQLEHAGSLD